MGNVSTAEKIETIVRARKSGSMGEFFDLAEMYPGEFPIGTYRVVADGKTFIVKCGTQHWHVKFKSFEGIDRELIRAAELAFDGGKDICVSSVKEALHWQDGTRIGPDLDSIFTKA
jgi:hypothetical protein